MMQHMMIDHEEPKGKAESLDTFNLSSKRCKDKREWAKDINDYPRAMHSDGSGQYKKFCNSSIQKNYGEQKEGSMDKFNCPTMSCKGQGVMTQGMLKNQQGTWRNNIDHSGSTLDDNMESLVVENFCTENNKKIVHRKEINFKERKVAIQRVVFGSGEGSDSRTRHADAGPNLLLSPKHVTDINQLLPDVYEEALSTEASMHKVSIGSILSFAEEGEVFLPGRCSGPYRRHWKRLARQRNAGEDSSRSGLGKRVIEGISDSDVEVIAREAVKKAKAGHYDSDDDTTPPTGAGSQPRRSQ